MDFDNVISSLEMLNEEDGIPKNLKSKISEIIQVLNSEDQDLDIRRHKAEAILDEVSEDVSLPSFIRTQIYQIVSLLQD